MEIRPARVDDVERLGVIHVRAWQDAYRGLMPDAFLDGLDPAERATMWRLTLGAPRPGHHVDVVLSPGGEIAGFAASGPDRDGTPETGELFAINLDPAWWGHGLGGALVRHVVATLTADEFPAAVLWVVDGNARARAVYERLGWAPDGGARTAAVLGATVPEVRYRIDLRR